MKGRPMRGVSEPSSDGTWPETLMYSAESPGPVSCKTCNVILLSLILWQALGFVGWTEAGRGTAFSSWRDIVSRYGDFLGFDFSPEQIFVS